MSPSLKSVKGFLLGGSYSYFVTQDNRYFVKLCKGRKEFVLKEYDNLKKYWNKLNVENLQLPEPISCSEQKEYLVTKYINANTLVKELDPKIYYAFGKVLKKFHQNGFSNCHIEFQDIIYENGRFIMADVPFLNEKSAIHDIVTLKINSNMYRLKKPWNVYKYYACWKAFLKGYQLKDSAEFKKNYQETINGRIKYLIKRGKKNKVKGYIFKVFYKLDFF